MSNARLPDVFNLCQFKFANGRRCGLPAHPKHDGLCLSHARREFQQREDDLSAELASPGVDFITAIDINHVLGKLFGSLAANRISARRAGTLAYISCLLMQTQKGAIHEARNWDYQLRAVSKLLEIKYPNVPVPAKKIPPAANT